MFDSSKNKSAAPPVLNQQNGNAALHAIEDGDLAAFNAMALNADSVLPNGETVATQVMKTQEKNYRDYGELCREFQQYDSGFHMKVEKIASLSQGLQPYGFYFTVVTRLSSSEFLDRLDIPYENRPDVTIGDDFNDAWEKFYPRLDSLSDKVIHTDAMLSQVQNKATASNEMYETPANLLENLNITRNQEMRHIARTTAVLEFAGEFAEHLENGIDAPTMLRLVVDRHMRDKFVWLTRYAPSENEFLTLFDPHWARRIGAQDQLAAAQNDEQALKRLQVLYLQDIGFYTWQPRRLTPAVKDIIDQDKQVKIDALSQELNRGKDYKEYVRHAEDDKTPQK